MVNNFTNINKTHNHLSLQTIQRHMALKLHGEVYTIQHYMIKCVSDLRQVTGFLRVLRFPQPYNTNHHDIAEIMLDHDGLLYYILIMTQRIHM